MKSEDTVTKLSYIHTMSQKSWVWGVYCHKQAPLPKQNLFIIRCTVILKVLGSRLDLYINEIPTSTFYSGIV